jgi:hypothetical protein
MSEGAEPKQDSQNRLPMSEGAEPKQEVTFAYFGYPV